MDGWIGCADRRRSPRAVKGFPLDHSDVQGGTNRRPAAEVADGLPGFPGSGSRCEPRPRRSANSCAGQSERSGQPENNAPLDPAQPTGEHEESADPVT